MKGLIRSTGARIFRVWGLKPLFPDPGDFCEEDGSTSEVQSEPLVSHRDAHKTQRNMNPADLLQASPGRTRRTVRIVVGVGDNGVAELLSELRVYS